MEFDLKKIFENKKNYLTLLFLIVVIPTVLLLIFSFMYTVDRNPFFKDFQIYYGWAKEFLQGGNPYESWVDYPPSFFLFMMPFTFLNIEIATVVFFMLNIVLLLLTTLLFIRILNYYDWNFSSKGKIYFFLAILFFYPNRDILFTGQINIVLLFLTTLFYYLFFISKSYIRASICLSTAIFIKIWPITLVPLLLTRKKAIVALGLTFLSFFALSLLIFGIEMHYAFAQTFLALQTKMSDVAIPSEFESVRFATDYIWSLTYTFFKILAFLGVTSSTLHLLDMLLLIPKIFFSAAIIYLIFKLIDKGREGEIIAFSLSITWIFIVANFAGSSYFAFFALPFVLIILVLESKLIEKILFASLFLILPSLFAIPFIALKIGGIFPVLSYITPPYFYAFLIWLAILYIKLKRLK